MKCRSYLIGVVSGLLLATAQAQSGSELNAAPFHENQSPSQYEETFHPPLPDIWVDGVLMSWEEVYGPIVILPPPVADNLSRSASAATTNFAQLEPVIQKRVLKCIGDIYMETQLYHKACQRYFYTHPDSLPPKEAYCFQFNPGICMVANMDGMNTLDSLSDNYVLDVRNQNNNNSFSMDLSTGIQNLFVNTTHQSNININEMLLYSVFYEILSDFLKD
jgi:hypothetical protein